MSRIKYLIFFIPLIFILSCAENQKKEEDKILNGLAEKYVRLGLKIGRYDPDFV